MTSNTSKEECLELKNINYQTMLLNNKSNIDSNKHSECSDKIESFLEKEKEMNKNKTWSKLSKANRLRKLMKFSNEYSTKNKLNEEDTKKLKNFLMEALDRRKLQKIKDVIYDIESGEIKSIPKLVFLKERKRFTIKRDKKSNSLKFCAPKTKKIKKIKKIKKNKKDGKKDCKKDGNKDVKKDKKVKRVQNKKASKTPKKSSKSK